MGVAVTAVVPTALGGSGRLSSPPGATRHPAWYAPRCMCVGATPTAVRTGVELEIESLDRSPLGAVLMRPADTVVAP
eukprot:357907-Chlamydomonas_euryale.AAC.7